MENSHRKISGAVPLTKKEKSREVSQESFPADFLQTHTLMFHEGQGPNKNGVEMFLLHYSCVLDEAQRTKSMQVSAFTNEKQRFGSKSVNRVLFFIPHPLRPLQWILRSNTRFSEMEFQLNPRPKERPGTPAWLGRRRCCVGCS